MLTSIPDRQVLVQTADGAIKKDNPDYSAWKRSDRLLRGWLTGLLSKEALGWVVRLDTTSVVWTAPLDHFAHESKEWELALLQQLQCLRKGTSTLNDYLRTFNNICDNLSLQLVRELMIAKRHSLFSKDLDLGMNHLLQQC